MAEPKLQSFENHARLVPIYHFVLFSILVLQLGWSGWRLFRAPSFETLLGLLLSSGLIILFFQARIMALTAQDRIIRLEERLRLARLLPADLQPRIEELSPGQLVALRFASDGELVALVRRVLDEKLQDRRAIKRLIRDWRPDHLRV